jgi:dolichol-phosphate mannosyltransferase
MILYARSLPTSNTLRVERLVDEHSLAQGLTVVIPTYNEADNLQRLATALLSLPLIGIKIIIIDDNSPDGTGKIADQLAAQHTGTITVSHRPCMLGLGTAYKTGFKMALESGAKFIAQMDADFSHSPDVLPLLLDKLQNADLVIGSRYVPGGSVDREWPVWRKGLSAFANFYARTILHMPVRDLTGGFRIWQRDALLKIPLQSVRSTGYGFQVETAYLAYCLGCRIREIPIYFADRSHGRSKMSFKIQVEAALRVIEMRFRYRNLPFSQQKLSSD